MATRRPLIWIFARLYRLDNGSTGDGRFEKVGLFARQRDPVSTFSRGMVQRLTIARAPCTSQTFCCWTNPTTGLDQDT
ncbi:MAG: hypothetical protein IPH82_23585 [Chloroflexi bacterium]|nr:hypothetical protein [Chloroflexota bacterium]